MIIDKITNKNDEWYTPAEAVYPLLDFMDPDFNTIWCPFDTEDSMYVQILRAAGYTVIATHISTGGDFFLLANKEFIEANSIDCIVSNPPYSMKNEVLETLFNLGTPFAMLMSCPGLFESQFRFNLFKNNNFDLIIFDKRVKFISEGGDYNAPPFSSWYVTQGLLTDSQINFVNLEVFK